MSYAKKGWPPHKTHLLGEENGHNGINRAERGDIFVNP